MSPYAKVWLHRIGAFLGLAGVVFVAIRLRGYADEIDFHRMGTGSYIAVAALASLFGVSNVLLGFGWRSLMLHLGAPVSWHWAIRTYAISQLAKYVPGNVLQFAGRQAIGVAAGIGNGPLAKSTVYELGFLVVGAALFSPLVLPLIAAGIPDWFGWVSFASVVAITLWLTVRVGGVDLCMAAGFYLSFLASSGLVFIAAYSVAGGLGDFTLYPAIAGAYVIAWLAGLITPGAPAGLGVREAVLLFLLSSLSDAPVILLAVVIGRLITVLGDVLFFACEQIFSWLYRTANRRN
ncbi:hypothetical protein [Mesorhizobium sp. B2-1-3A]|uniref:hypothetical protein n=1 Tax=Mesorhizobium sp. B2-1-3A TaxID=2589971 RepID=UPI00112DCD17|nr:hypothetical protein [Mesorhizobium sp. B2-1-3A]TPN01696.1 hypothetical protein FJ977_04175 [Mesorhizobium sp. B2-1-3A]